MIKAEGITVHCNMYAIKTGWEIALKMVCHYLSTHVLIIQYNGKDNFWHKLALK